MATTTNAADFGFHHQFLLKPAAGSIGLISFKEQSQYARRHILRLSTPAFSGDASGTDVWHDYYKRNLNKGIGYTVGGATSLIASVGLMAVGVMELTGAVGGTYGYTTTYTADNFVSASSPQWTSTTTQTVNPNVVAGVVLLSAGVILLPVGLTLLPVGTKFLHRAARIKSEAANQDIRVSVVPRINPASNTYACALKIKF